MPPPEPIDLAAAVQRLRSGGLVAFPTETVYGLGADAFNEAAVRRVFQLKGRPAENPLIIHVADAGMARAVAGVWPAQAESLAGAFWPGPLSIVVPRAPRVPAVVTSGSPNVAVRCPDHPLALALIRAFGAPLVGPSANPSGRVSPTTAAHVRQAFAESDVLVLDGGPCRAGIESTVVSVIGAPRILRPGPIGATEIERVIGQHVEGPRDARPGERTDSPGRLPVHYAPRSRAALYSTDDDLRELLDATDGVVVIITESPARLPPPPDRLIQMPRHAEAYAARLYAALHEADAAQPDLIAIHRPEVSGDDREQAVWRAVLDRLARAVTPAP